MGKELLFLYLYVSISKQILSDNAAKPGEKDAFTINSNKYGQR